jgi:hypothetical protein
MNPKGAGCAIFVFAVILSSASLSGLSGRGNGMEQTPSSDRGPLLLNGLGSGWSQATQSSHPPGVAGSMMAYDGRADVFVLFGGSDGMPLNRTWILDPKTQTWAEFHPPLSPPVRADAMFVYDSTADALILFGGWNETSDGSYHRLSDTWAFFVGNHTWTQRHPASGPSPRSDAAVAFDDANGITLLFGGFDGKSYLGDTWYFVFANDSWIPRDSSRRPSPRADGRMVYDSQHRLFYLFSGNDYSDPSFNFHHLEDMWRYSWTDNAWAQIFPDTLPMPRDYAVFVSDLAFDELLLVGGYGNRVILDDVWAFNTTQLVWRNVSTPTGPSPRMAAVGGYTPREDSVVMFGGGDRSEVKTDTWFFRYPPPLIGRVSASSTDPLTGQEVAFTTEIRGGSGFLTSASWDFGDGHTIHGQSATHSFGLPGIYRVGFVAIDGRGAQMSGTIQVDVGFLVPFWIDVALLFLPLSLAVVAVYRFLQRRRHRTL